MAQLLLAEAKGRLKESTNGGKRRVITAIEAGWGSSGYYSEEVLNRDFATIFPTGTPMYMDHPTIKEEYERPERSIRDLVGVTESEFRSSGIAQEASCKVFEHWVPYINEVAPHTGLSIRAFGLAESGSAAGKDGPIVQTLEEGISIDYVTAPGAGGKVGEILESARGKELLESARAVGSPHVSREALQSTLYSNLESAGEAMFNADERFDSYVYVDDFDVDANWVIYSVRQGDAERILVKVPYTRDTNGTVSLGDAAEKVNRATTYEDLGSLDLSESRSGGGNPTEEDGMSDEDKRKLSELEESVATLKKDLDETKVSLAEEKKGRERAEEGLVLREAGKIADEIASEVTDLPSRAKARVISEALAGDLPVDSKGKLLESEFRETAKKALKEEVEYISETSGRGKVTGAGAGSQFHESGRRSGNDGSDDESKTALQESFERRGMSKDAAKAAAEGR